MRYGVVPASCIVLLAVGVALATVVSARALAPPGGLLVAAALAAVVGPSVGWWLRRSSANLLLAGVTAGVLTLAALAVLALVAT